MFVHKHMHFSNVRAIPAAIRSYKKVSITNEDNLTGVLFYIFKSEIWLYYFSN